MARGAPRRRGRTPTVTAKRGIGGCRLINLHRYALTAPSGCRLICIITFVMEIDRMKKLIVLTAAVALLSGVSMSTFAAKSPEEMSKAKAEKQHVSADKMDAFVKTCVEQHSKHAAKHPAPAGGTAAPAAPESPPAAPAKLAAAVPRPRRKAGFLFLRYRHFLLPRARSPTMAAIKAARPPAIRRGNSSPRSSMKNIG